MLLVVVILIEVIIFLLCWILAGADDSSKLNELCRQFKRDIIGRASRGNGPDWVRYMDEADRVHDRSVDQLRVLATSALVVGIGGTMFALASRLTGMNGALDAIADHDPPAAALGGLIAAVGSALWASFSGVVNNVLILWLFFPKSDWRFAVSLDEFRNVLQECSDENSPHEKFADAVRDQLGNAFRDAVRTFPRAFARLDESVKSLGEVTEAQSKAVLEAAARLKEGADGLTFAALKIVPAATLLQSSTDHLRALPDQFKQIFDETCATWEQEIRRDQDAFINVVQEVASNQEALLERTKSAFDEWEDKRRDSAAQQEAEWQHTINLIQVSASEIVKTVNGLPGMFTKEVGRTADTMGKQFGLEARQHVGDLIMAIRDGNKSFREQIEANSRDLQSRFLNDTSRVVEKTLDRVYRRVEGTLLDELNEVGKGINEALVKLPANAQTFASSLSAADDKLRLSIERITESADHLKRVAELTEHFEKSLADALKNAVAPNMELLERQMSKVVSEMQRTYNSIDEVLRRFDPPVKRRFEFFRKVFGIQARHRGRDDVP